MTRDLHPTEGARYLLELSTDDGARAIYRATIFVPAEQFPIEVTITDDGSATLAGSTAPLELSDRLVNMAKLVGRDVKKRREDGLPPWPARVLRWRR